MNSEVLSVLFITEDKVLRISDKTLVFSVHINNLFGENTLVEVKNDLLLDNLQSGTSWN